VEVDGGRDETDLHYLRLLSEATASGYFLNPDEAFARELVKGLITNRKRYGYQSCPCRLASGDSVADRDIVCPCDYRDADLGEYGACYCALYVSQAANAGREKIGPVPERRPQARKADTGLKAGSSSPETPLPYPVWRCRVCGYLCAREGPPEICPICKAKKDRFERFM
jgi:ferredoxin-thioredoxin reductase catalytic subunit